MKDERDKAFLVGAFLLVKVMAGKLCFKPYKLTAFFEKTIRQTENPVSFRESCVCMGYTMIALYTDYIFDLYRVELERLEGFEIKTANDVALVKGNMFRDLLPIADDYVQYEDFARVSKRPDWAKLVQNIGRLIGKTLEAVKAHRHLTDAGLQLRAKEDLREIIKLRTKAFYELKRKLARDRDERYAREADDDASTDSEGEEARE